MGHKGPAIISKYYSIIVDFTWDLFGESQDKMGEGEQLFARDNRRQNQSCELYVYFVNTCTDCWMSFLLKSHSNTWMLLFGTLTWH